MDEKLLLFVVGLAILLLTLGLKHTDTPLIDSEEEVENALDTLLMYEMDEEDE